MRKVEATVTINKPAQEVWDYMDNPDNMPLWLDGFVKYEHKSGEHGKVGSKGLQYYNENGREFVMEEEIVEVREPEYIKLNVTSKPMDMVIENTFVAKDENTTVFTGSATFTRVGFFMNIMMALFQPTKKAQAQHEKQLNKFKELVEAQ